jgi:hypothetical protein
MSKPDQKTDKPAITRRMVFCVQSQGDITKTTTLCGLISWLKYAEIPFAASDSDSQHKTLLNRNPGFVKEFNATESAEAFQTLIQRLPDKPVIIVDFPGNRTDEILTAFDRFQVLDGFERTGIRPTIPLFAHNDEKAAASAAVAVRDHFQDRADYLLFKVPSRFKSHKFERTLFYKWLMERGTPVIEVPGVTDQTFLTWNALEKQEGKRFSIDDLCDPDFQMIDWTVKSDLQRLRNEFLASFEEHAVPRLISDPSMIKKKVARFRPLRTVSVADGALSDSWL